MHAFTAGTSLPATIRRVQHSSGSARPCPPSQRRPRAPSFFQQHAATAPAPRRVADGCPGRLPAADQRWPLIGSDRERRPRSPRLVGAPAALLPAGTDPWRRRQHGGAGAAGPLDRWAAAAAPRRPALPPAAACRRSSRSRGQPARMIKLFSVKVRCRRRTSHPGWSPCLPLPARPPGHVAIRRASPSRHAALCLQEKQKKDAAAAANGKAVKQVRWGRRLTFCSCLLMPHPHAARCAPSRFPPPAPGCPAHAPRCRCPPAPAVGGRAAIAEGHFGAGPA